MFSICFIIVVGPPNPESMPEDGKLKSEMMIKENRRYYLDLKENSRGRFLRVSLKSCLFMREEVKKLNIGSD